MTRVPELIRGPFSLSEGRWEPNGEPPHAASCFLLLLPPNTAFMVSAPLVITGLSCLRYTASVTRVPACPTRSAMVSQGTSSALMIETYECGWSGLPLDAGEQIRTPFKGHRQRPRLPRGQKDVNRSHAGMCALGERVVATLKTWKVLTTTALLPAPRHRGRAGDPRPGRARPPALAQRPRPPPRSAGRPTPRTRPHPQREGHPLGRPTTHACSLNPSRKPVIMSGHSTSLCLRPRCARPSA